MRIRILAMTLLACSAALCQTPLPELKIEPTTGGSIFHLRNTASQPLTAYLIELVNYPGSSYSYLHDDVLHPMAAGETKEIRVANMTVGAVPDYVKMTAALYADGSSAGIPERVTQLVERRRAMLETTRELIRRLEKAADKNAAIADLKQWVDSLPAISRANRNSQAAVNQNATRSLIGQTSSELESGPLAEALAKLRTSEKALSGSKPAL